MWNQNRMINAEATSNLWVRNLSYKRLEDAMAAKDALQGTVLRGYAIKIDFAKPVQGRDRLVVKCVGEQLGLEGSYIPCTYIEQIHLEKLVNEALPDDLKTKLSIDEDLVSSPRVTVVRSYVDKIVTSDKNLNRDKYIAKLTGYAVSNRTFDDRTVEPPATFRNQGVVTHLSEQISTLNDRMDELTSRIEELNLKLTGTRVSASSPESMSLQGEACNGSGPTSYFISSLSNGSLTGPMLLNSSSSSHLAKYSPLIEEIQVLEKTISWNNNPKMEFVVEDSAIEMILNPAR